MKSGLATILAALTTALAWSVPAAVQGRMPTPPPVAVAPGALASPATTAQRARCGPEPTSAAGWSRLFGGLDGDWAGGDAALSVRLADGRLLWVFGDSLTGEVRADGRRAPGATIVRSSVLVSDGTCVTAATPRRTSLPGSGGTWLWPTSVLLQRTTTAGGSTVVVLAQRMRSTGSGAWSFARVGASSVVLTVAPHGAVTIGRAHDLPASDVLWGAGSVVRGATTYLYGTRVVHQPLVMGRDLLVARAPTARVTDPTTWSYRTAAGWSTRAADAAVVLPAASGVSTNPAVVVVDGRYRVVTKPQEYLDDRVVELTSSTPYGPWTSRLLFRSPSTAAAPTYSPAVVATRTGARGVVVVSRTSTVLGTLMTDGRSARPLFRDVDLGA